MGVVWDDGPRPRVSTIEWTPGRVAWAIRHPRLTRRHIRAVKAEWPDVTNVTQVNT